MASTGIDAPELRQREAARPQKPAATGKTAAAAAPAESNDNEKATHKTTNPGQDADVGLVVDLAAPEIRKIADKLKDAGFFTSIESGAGQSALLFARISPGRLAQAAVDSQARDWKAGVQTDEISESHGNLSVATRQRLVLDALREEGIVPERLEGLSQIFPISDRAIDRTIWNDALTGFSFNLEKIRNYYGEEVALYFAFLSYITRFAVFPTIIALSSHYLLGPFSPIPAALVIGWAVVVTLLWRRREKELAVAWNTEHVVNIKTPRASYRGLAEKDRKIRSFWYVPLASYLIILYVLGLCVSLALEVFVTQIYDGPFKSILALTPTGANTALAIVFGIIYASFLGRFLDFEDYEFEEDYNQAKTQRQFYLSFFLNYTPLLLTAYLYLPFGHLISDTLPTIRALAGESVPIVSSFKLNTGRLATQAAYYAITNQIVGVTTDAVLPVVIQFAKQLIRPDSKPGANWRVYQSLAPYDPNTDYLLVVSLFGYALITTPVWPLTPVAALVGLLARFKAAAAKLTLETRKPWPRRVNSIGPWNLNLLVLCGMASITLPTMIAMYGQTSDDRLLAQQSYANTSLVVILVLVIVGENLFLLSVGIIGSFIDVAPASGPKVEPKKQTAVPAEPTESDLHWSKRDIEPEIAGIVNA